MRAIFFLLVFLFPQTWASYNTFREAEEGIQHARGFLARATVFTNDDTFSGVFLGSRHVLTCLHGVAKIVAEGGNIIVAYGTPPLPFPPNPLEPEPKSLDETLLRQNLRFAYVGRVLYPQNTFLLTQEEFRKNQEQLDALHFTFIPSLKKYLLGDDLILLELEQDTAPLVIKFPTLCPTDFLSEGESFEAKIFASAGDICVRTSDFTTAKVRPAHHYVPHMYCNRFQYHKASNELIFEYTFAELRAMERIMGFPHGTAVDGNSGAPLMVTRGDNDIVIGIVSRGRGGMIIPFMEPELKDKGTKQEIAAGLSPHTTWIQKAVKGESLPRFCYPFFCNDRDLSPYQSVNLRFSPENFRVMMSHEQGLKTSFFDNTGAGVSWYELVERYKSTPVTFVLPPEVSEDSPVNVHGSFQQTADVTHLKMTAPRLTFRDVWIQGATHLSVHKHSKYPSYLKTIILERLAESSGIYIDGTIDFSTPLPRLQDDLIVYGCNIALEFQ